MCQRQQKSSRCRDSLGGLVLGQDVNNASGTRQESLLAARSIFAGLTIIHESGLLISGIVINFVMSLILLIFSISMRHQPYPNGQLLVLLRKAKVRPSVQRLAVLGYVADKRSHPTADEIYSSLSLEIPSLSRATVYNSLHTLVDGGILRELEIENGATRYDMAAQPSHGHFICGRCGKIFDIPVPGGLDAAIPEGFKAASIDVYAKGICPACLAKE